MARVIAAGQLPDDSDVDTEDEGERSSAVNQALDLAKLQQNLLHGEELTAFIARSYEMLEENK